MSEHSSHPMDEGPLSLRRILRAFDPQEVEASSLSLLHELPGTWNELDEGDIECTRLTDGITNTLIKVSRPQQEQSAAERDDVLIRAYGNGTDAIIDREKELRAHSLLASKGLAPELLVRFENGFMYRFVQGEPCTPQDYHDPQTSRRIAEKLGQWHGSLSTSVLCENYQTLPGEARDSRPVPNIWTNARKWIGFLPATTEAVKQRNDIFYRELAWLEELFADIPGLNGQDYVFSHTDLLCANVVLTEKQGVTFIDYEYATAAPAAFDISNVFAEWAGPDQVYEWMPSRSQRMALIECYVDSFRKHSGSIKLPNDVSYLYDQVEAFRGVSGFYWGIWGLCQASISDIDFDYDVYAERRHSEYWGWKTEYLGTRERDGKEMTVRERAWARE